MKSKEFLARYGNPDVDGNGILDTDWARENLTVFTLPFPMRLSWEPRTYITKIQAHRLAGPRIIKALEALAEKVPPEELSRRRLDSWGGCFNFRLVRGGTCLSDHAWGTAVDICPEIGRLGSAADRDTYPRAIIEAFESQGFYWGGHFCRPDAMHFELHD